MSESRLARASSTFDCEAKSLLPRVDCRVNSASRLDQVGLGRRQRRLRLLQLRLIRRRLDDEQRVGLLGLGAVLIVDLLQKALHPRLEIDLIVRDRVAGDFQIRQHVLLQRLRNADLRRRRRDVGVLLLTRRGYRQRQAQHHEA